MISTYQRLKRQREAGEVDGGFTHRPFHDLDLLRGKSRSSRERCGQRRHRQASLHLISPLSSRVSRVSLQ